jgi:uncharacterized membrane-anchored protein
MAGFKGLWVAGVASLVVAATAWAAGEPEKNNPLAELAWQKGPTTLQLGTKASIKLPGQTGALSGGESDKFMKLTGNLPIPGLNIVAGGNWFAVFAFDESGYIKDDEKIDADALIKQIQDNDGPSNEERRKVGMPELHTDGWYVPPHYDDKTKALEWGIKLHSSDNPRPVINYTVRMLGRSGYERIVLVSDPQHLDADVVDFKRILAGFDFVAGEKYSEFKPGDHVAEFGLAALVAGGAAAVAAKTGLWKSLLVALAAGWKVVAAAAVAVVAGLGRFFKRKGPSA